MTSPGTAPTVKDCVSGRVYFLRYQSRELWYVCDNGFIFPVPIDDTGDAAFYVEDKGIMFMRWIRRHLEVIRLAVEAQGR